MRRNRDRRIGVEKIRLIHVAKNQLGMDDAAYRAMLARVTGVRSAMDLGEQAFVAVMAEFERCGFVRAPVPVRQATNAHDRPAEAQWRGIETLARKVGFRGMLDPRFIGWMTAIAKVSHPQFLDANGARSVIAALTNWSQRAASGSCGSA